MSVSKTIGIVTGAIPVMGLLIGGVTYGVTFKTTVEDLEEKTAHQETINKSLQERYASIPQAYDDTDIWTALDDVWVPDEYDDSHITDRIQQLDIDLVELRTIIGNFDLGESYDDSDLRRRLVELEGAINSLANVEMNSNGDVDVRSVIVQVSSMEGTLQGIRSTLNTLDNKITSTKSDMRTLQNQVSTLERSKSGGSTPVQRYDDTSVKSDIRDLSSSIRTLQSQMSNISSSAGSTSSRTIENPYDDSTIRNDIRQLRADLTSLARNNNDYDDSSLRISINNLQNDISTLHDKLGHISNQSSNDPRIDNLLGDVYHIKEEITDRLTYLEKAVNSFDTNSGLHEFQEQLYEQMSYTLEDIYFQIEDNRSQIKELYNIVYDINNTNNTTTNNNSNNSNNNIEVYILDIKHKETSYTGIYYLDHYYNNKPVWINYECDKPGSKFERCYIFEYKPGMWVIQPLAPSTEWLANAYVYAEWPWEGTWDGDVKRVKIVE